jgi:hypothetical protein
MTMEPLALSPQTFVADLLVSTPLMAPLFVELQVDCIGCSMNKFCTLEDLCDQYQLELETVLNMIQERITNHESN